MLVETQILSQRLLDGSFGFFFLERIFLLITSGCSFAPHHTTPLPKNKKTKKNPNKNVDFPAWRAPLLRFPLVPHDFCLVLLSSSPPPLLELRIAGVFRIYFFHLKKKHVEFRLVFPSLESFGISCLWKFVICSEWLPSYVYCTR